MAVTPISIPTSSLKNQLYSQRINSRDKLGFESKYQQIHQGGRLSLTTLNQQAHPLDEYEDSDTNSDDNDVFDDYDGEGDSSFRAGSLSSQASSFISSYTIGGSPNSPTSSFSSPIISCNVGTSSCVSTINVVPKISRSRSSSSTSSLKALFENDCEIGQKNSVTSLSVFLKRDEARVGLDSSTPNVGGSVSLTSPETDLSHFNFKSKASTSEYSIDPLMPEKKSFYAHLASFAISPREMFVALFANGQMKMNETKCSASRIPQEQQLETWSMKCRPQNPVIKAKPTRNREYRMNSKFLLMYSFDCKSRSEGYLPRTQQYEEYQELENNEAIKKFHVKYDIFKISSMSRDKLWANVILPARNDSLPSSKVDYRNYEYEEGEGNSIVKLDGCEYLPWVNMKYQLKSLKPAGILETGKVLVNGVTPNCGVSRTQYTVKGWCNKKWIPIESASDVNKD